MPVFNLTGTAPPLERSHPNAMNPTSPPPVARRSARRLWLWGLLATPPLLLLLLGAGVASFFLLGSDTRALRNGLMKSSGVAWRQQIALNAGHLTVGAVRAGLSRANLDPATCAALQSVRSAEVGVYQLAPGTPPPDGAAMLAGADSAMTFRGWERTVGVMDGHNLVAVYLPGKNISAHRLKCCVLVLDGREMVLVSVQGNPEPLLRYAFNQATLHAPARWLAQR